MIFKLTNKPYKMKPPFSRAFKEDIYERYLTLRLVTLRGL